MIRNQANETSAAFWSDSEIYTLISTGETTLTQLIGCTESTDTSINTVDSTREYAAPANLGTIVRLTWDQYRCKAIDLNQLDEIEGQAYGGVTVTGQPEYYYRFGANIGFSPIPDRTGNVSISHYATPTEITSTSTTFTMPAKYAQYIADYVLWMMFTKDQQLQEEAAFYRQKWMDDVQVIQSDWNKTRYRDQYPSVVVRDGIFLS